MRRRKDVRHLAIQFWFTMFSFRTRVSHKDDTDNISCFEYLHYLNLSHKKAYTFELPTSFLDNGKIHKIPIENYFKLHLLI